MTAQEHGRAADARRRWGLAANDLLRDRAYQRLWSAVLLGSLGQQVTLLALPLTAALLLNATPSQMGLLTAMETLPFVLLSLPAGVWLDRVRKLPVYIVGELLVGLSVASVPLAWWAGWLGMPWLYAVGFTVGMVNTSAGSASQIVLTQVVPRERLVEAHARNALASSGAEVAGPGLAGALIKLLGPALALVFDALLLLGSALVLRRLKVDEQLPPRRSASFWQDLVAGLRFVRSQPLLVALAASVGTWQFCYNGVMGVQILFATRTLALSEQAIGLCYVGVGVGTITASTFGNAVSERLGPGPTMVLGFALCGLSWLLPPLALAAAPGLAVPAFALMLALGGAGAVLLFINFLGMRQAVTPSPLLGRMTASMRWLILLPAAPGALLGGWIGEHVGLAQALACAGVLGLLLALVSSRVPAIRSVKTLPQAADDPQAPA